MQTIKQFNAVAPPVILTPADDILNGLNTLNFAGLYKNCSEQLRLKGVQAPDIISPAHKDLKTFDDALKNSYPEPVGRDFWEAAGWVATFKKLFLMQTAMVCEDYSAMEEEAVKIVSIQKRYLERLAGDSSFIRIRDVARYNRFSHPRLVTCAEQAVAAAQNNQTMVIFTERECTGMLLLEMLRKKNLRVEIVMHEKDNPDHVATSSLPHRANAFESLVGRQLDVLICSSLLQAKAFNAAPDIFLQLTAPNPFERKSMLEERLDNGWLERIPQILLDHKLDKHRYRLCYFCGTSPGFIWDKNRLRQRPLTFPPADLKLANPRRAKKPPRGFVHANQLRLFNESV